MAPEIAVELIRLLPTIFWILFTSVVVAVFYKPIRYELLPKIGSFKAFGVEFTFVRAELDKAVKQQGVSVSEDDRSRVLRRAARLHPVVQGAEILWVDDNPNNNVYLRNILARFDISVDIAVSTEEALQMLEKKNYELVISDMRRGNKPQAGIELLNEMRDRGLYRWTFFYMRNVDASKGTPPYAFAITDRPHQVIHYVLDILERERG